MTVMVEPELPVSDRPMWRGVVAGTPGRLGAAFLALVFAACVLTLPWSLGSAPDPVGTGASTVPPARFERQDRAASRLPPTWWRYSDRQAAQYATLEGRPAYLMGTDVLGRDLFWRCLLGGAISLTIGVCAAFVSVTIGTLYGALAGWMGGRVDGFMMRVVDVLYGLPTILLVVLLGVAIDAVLARQQAQGAGLSPWQYQAVNILTLLIAIGGVSWLTMARVVRGQVLSLKERPFIEAARAVGVGPWRLFRRHLLPSLTGPIIVYATLAVPQAILQESFLSFLGIGVKPPLPSWGTLAADGLGELNIVQSQWWLLLFPCLLLGGTLLALNLFGEGLREALDPRAAKREVGP